MFALVNIPKETLSNIWIDVFFCYRITRNKGRANLIKVEGKKRKGPIMLVVAPTRELAMQSQDVLEEAAKFVKIRRNDCYVINKDIMNIHLF